MITVNLYYTGTNGSARAFAEEMVQTGVVTAIRAEDGNLRCEYFFPMDDPETVLLIDQWRDQEAIDVHHASPMMGQIAALREKYDLHMKVERFVSDGAVFGRYAVDQSRGAGVVRIGVEGDPLPFGDRVIHHA